MGAGGIKIGLISDKARRGRFEDDLFGFGLQKWRIELNAEVVDDKGDAIDDTEDDTKIQEARASVSKELSSKRGPARTRCSQSVTSVAALRRGDGQ